MIPKKNYCPKPPLILEKVWGGGGLKHNQKWWWRPNGRCFLNYRNKPYNAKPIWVCLFCIIFVAFFWLRYLSCFRHNDKSGYGFPKFIHHILVGAHQAKLFSNKIFSRNSVLQIVRLMVLLWFLLKLGCSLHCFMIQIQINLQAACQQKKTSLLCSI